MEGSERNHENGVSHGGCLCARVSFMERRRSGARAVKHLKCRCNLLGPTRSTMMKPRHERSVFIIFIIMRILIISRRYDATRTANSNACKEGEHIIS